MVETVLFDLDNTLFDFNKAERLAVEKTLRHLGLMPREEDLKRYSAINLAQWKLLELGKLSRDEVKRRRYQLLFEELGVERSPQEAAAFYEAQLAVGHYFIEGAEELLARLYGKVRLYLVTNGTADVQRGRLKSAGIGHYFEDIFISELLGYDKPSREYFDCCFARMKGASRERTVIVGDSLTSDILGGKNAGIATIWFNPAKAAGDPAIVPDFEAASLAEVGDVIERL